MKKVAFGIIDAQRGFMPAAEGERLNLEGFGELPVPDGHAIVPVINRLLRHASPEVFVFTTQDWHPMDTAHFAQEPDYNTTWPPHCRANTPGAEIHPEIQLPEQTVRYKKGNEVLEHGSEDTSYTGFNGVDETGQSLGERLTEERVEVVYLTGLATDYCVKATALDLREKLNVEVLLNLIGCRGVAPETTQAAINEMREVGVVIKHDLIDRWA